MVVYDKTASGLNAARARIVKASRDAARVARTVQANEDEAIDSWHSNNEARTDALSAHNRKGLGTFTATPSSPDLTIVNCVFPVIDFAKKVALAAGTPRTVVVDDETKDGTRRLDLHADLRTSFERRSKMVRHSEQATITNAAPPPWQRVRWGHSICTSLIQNQRSVVSHPKS